MAVNDIVRSVQDAMGLERAVTVWLKLCDASVPEPVTVTLIFWVAVC